MVLNYEDFGPQVIASEVIGMEWWQWEPHGESRPISYDVRVVVFRNVTLTEVKNLYPVRPEQEKDYRYLEYDAALNYLNDNISENVIEEVTARLKNTKKQIVKQLGGKA